jgi:hypothetical protein
VSTAGNALRTCIFWTKRGAYGRGGLRRDGVPLVRARSSGKGALERKHGVFGAGAGARSAAAVCIQRRRDGGVTLQREARFCGARGRFLFLGGPTGSNVGAVINEVAAVAQWLVEGLVEGQAGTIVPASVAGQMAKRPSMAFSAPAPSRGSVPEAWVGRRALRSRVAMLSVRGSALQRSLLGHAGQHPLLHL